MKKISIPTPCREEVLVYWQQFGSTANYRYQVAENVLQIVLKQCPHNTVLEHVWLKVVVLNKFYSTQILDTFSVAKRIVELQIDPRLEAVDIALVDDLTPMTAGGKPRKLYSFATKYCNYHMPGRFPIYDSYVEKMLLHFRGVNNFDNFKLAELKGYKRFFDLISNFQTCFNLKEFDAKQLDAYLWLAGKHYFSKPQAKSIVPAA